MATAVAERGRSRVSLASEQDGTITWPVTGTDPAAGLRLPRGSGLDVAPAVDYRHWLAEYGGLGQPARENRGQSGQ
ncbi:hypothetical protein ACFYN3_40325 [Streptomyces lavendulae]|uniref:hypothetical protein n=1 Tax=Streptomyces lavendulae TaxID=1914 RepID=UPI003675D65B